MGKLWLLAGLTVFGAITGWATPPPGSPTGRAPHEHQVQQMTFAENKGQWTPEARYKASLSDNGVLFLTDQGLVYNFVSKEDILKIHHTKESKESEYPVIHGHAYKVNFVGSNPGVTYTTADKKQTYHNYFIGNDPKKWAGNVGLYGTVMQHDVYTGVDFKIYGASGDHLKYDFIVHPGADPQQIALSFDGVKPALLRDGSLEIATTVNKVREQAPVCYQVIEGQKVMVPSAYRFNEGVLSYHFPKGYNKAYELVIDPSVVFATFSGSNNSNPFDGGVNGYGATYDTAGNTYTSATIFAWGWPTTTGAYQTTVPSAFSIGINKYNANGTALVYSTYFGGNSGRILPSSLRVTNNQELVMTGYTETATLPVTAGAYQSSLKGTSDMYVVKFNAAGSALVGCTYLGGTGPEAYYMNIIYFAPYAPGNYGYSTVDVAFDKQDNIWISGNSGSTDFPTTPGAIQNVLGGNHDATITRFNPTLTTLQYGSYIGGSAWDGAYSIEYDPGADRIAIAGSTISSNYPVSFGAYKPARPGGRLDGFVTVIDNNNFFFLASTYIGTDTTDYAMRVAFDCNHNVYVAGNSLGNYPVTNTTAQGLVSNGPVFIDKLSPALNASLASTRTGLRTGYMGDIFPSSLIVDKCGNIAVSTFTWSLKQTGMPVTTDAIDTSPKPFYMAVFRDDFAGLKFGSYFGDPNSEHFHSGINRIDPRGIFYQAVCTGAPNFPTTAGAYAPLKLNGNVNDNVTFKIKYETSIPVDMTVTTGGGANDPRYHTVRGCKPAQITFTRTGDTTGPLVLHINKSGSAVNGVDYTLLPDTIQLAAMQTSRTIDIAGLLPANGTKMLIIDLLEPCSCQNPTDIVKRDTIYIYDALYANLTTPLPAYCPGTQIAITGATDPSLQFSWAPAQYNLGSLTINPVITQDEDFVFTVTQSGAPATCPSRSITFHAVTEPYPQIIMTDDTAACGQDSLMIPVQVLPDNINYIYNWTPVTGLRAANIATNYIWMPVGVYNYTFSASSPNAHCTTTKQLTVEFRAPTPLFGITPPSGTLVDYGKEVTMSAQGAVFYTWYPLGAFHDFREQSPTTYPVTEPKTYTVVGVDGYGCKDTADIYIDVRYPLDPIMPNAFTPNGDGRNDVFGLTNAKFQKLLRFEIYNRYGQQVFTTTDPMSGWDGNYKGGPCDQGVYQYIITVELPNKEKKTYKGDITLLR